MSEVGTFTSVTQFHGPDINECGFYAVATALGCAAPGSPGWSAAQIATVADSDAQRMGDANGMTQESLHTDLAYHHLKFADIAANWNSVKQAVQAGTPVIVCVPESQVFDVAVGGSPYPWNSDGIDHIILVTGVASSGNIYVRDSANIVAPNSIRPGPREYKTGMTLYWSTAVTPAWKEEELATAQEYDTLYKKYTAVCASYNEVRDEKDKLIGANNSLKAQLAAAKTPVSPKIAQAIALLQSI